MRWSEVRWDEMRLPYLISSQLVHFSAQYVRHKATQFEVDETNRNEVGHDFLLRRLWLRVETFKKIISYLPRSIGHRRPSVDAVSCKFSLLHIWSSEVSCSGVSGFISWALSNSSCSRPLCRTSDRHSSSIAGASMLYYFLIIVQITRLVSSHAISTDLMSSELSGSEHTVKRPSLQWLQAIRTKKVVLSCLIE